MGQNWGYRSVSSGLRHIAVLIPARDEEQLLPRCLDSVISATSLLPRTVSCDIVVAVDSSTDRTQAIAEKMLRGYGEVVRTSAGVVGSTRAYAAHRALSRYAGPLDRCWLANTDADCTVPNTWLIDQLSVAGDEVEAIAGTVDVDNFVEHRLGVEDLFQKTYLIHADGTHPHVHGANLGVRADAYVRVGGWAPLCTAEDHDLWNRLCRADCRRLSAGWLKVVTSGRRIGRAPHGFAEALAAHNEAVA